MRVDRGLSFISSIMVPLIYRVMEIVKSLCFGNR